MNILNKIASWFQPTYSKIEALKLPMNVKMALDAVWDNLSPALQKALWNFIALIIAKYGEEKGKEILSKILPNLQT